MAQQEVTVRLKIRTVKGGTIKDEVSPDSDSQLERSLRHMLSKAELGYDSVTAEWEEGAFQYTFTLKRKSEKGKGESESASTKQGAGRKQAGVSSGKPDKAKKGAQGTQLPRNSNRGDGRDAGNSTASRRELSIQQGASVPNKRKPPANQRTRGSSSR